MKRSVKFGILTVLAAFAAFGAVSGYLSGKLPVRSGTLTLARLHAPVSVRYDEVGVPHIRAGSEADLYRALGYVHAQDRLFQMEMLRRLARGELAEIYGQPLLDVDRLFRTLRLREWADGYAGRMDMTTPASQALIAYIDGINQYQQSRPAPLEFDLLRIPKRPFTVADTLSVSGYLAWSFALTLKTEPVMSYLRDELGPAWVKPFVQPWQPAGVLAPARQGVATPADAHQARTAAPAAVNWQNLAQLAQLTQTAASLAGVPQLQGSNAWAISGTRTQSGKPLLAGDPHIQFAVPAVWFEAHLSAPGFDLYGHHAALIPTALLGLNAQFAWSLTMFQNDDMDLVRERRNPANPAQLWSGDARTGHWVDIETRHEQIRVRDAAPVDLRLERGPHGPLIGAVMQDQNTQADAAPIALWWTLYADDAPLLDAMYALNRADTLPKARAAASQIHAPGLNVVWANAAGDIGWWAAARLPRRPPGVDPAFILDAGKGEAEKPGWYPFSANPQEENPARGFIASANHQPVSAQGLTIPGYYALPERIMRLSETLASATPAWTAERALALQTDPGNAWGPHLLTTLVPILRPRLNHPDELALLDQLAQWDGNYALDGIAPTVFSQLLYETVRSTTADELGPAMFQALLGMRSLDQAIGRLLADADSPWWDDRGTPQTEQRGDTLLAAWNATLAHLRRHLGDDPAQWRWARAHTVTLAHPLGKLQPLDALFNVGPFAAPGGYETPNNYTGPIGPLPQAVVYGPSTRRVIDFAHPEASLGSNPVGQSGVRFDAHYSDQAAAHIAGRSRIQHLSEADVALHTRSALWLAPAAAKKQ